MMTAVRILDELLQAGIKPEVLDENRLAVPSGVLNDDMRHAIRSHKAELIELLQADQSSASENMLVHDRAAGDTQACPTMGCMVAMVSTPEQTIEWRPLADVYYRHHFGCLQCMAAGQNPHLLRCTTGHPLWEQYRAAFLQSKRTAGHRGVNTEACDGKK